MTGSVLSTLCAADVVSMISLAVRAVIGGALTLGDLAYEVSAHAARLSIALVDIELLAKISRIAIGADVVAQRRAAGADRGLQRRPYRAHQARTLRSCE